MRANSLILSYHSSVFVRLFLELHQSVLEVDDFVGEAVKSFLGALYSGEIQLDRQLFRDVNKMCHVFKVQWLSGRCRDYFTGLVSEVSVHTDYKTLLFLFEEARFCMGVMKCDKFLDLVVQKICGLENRAEIFVEPYMKNYTELENKQLDLMIQVTKNNPVSLLKIIKRNLDKTGKPFDQASRYLLKTIDLCQCIADDETLFDDLFDILDGISLSNDHDSTLINTLYRKSMKKFKETLRLSPSRLSIEGRGTCSLPMSQKIPNIFCSFFPFLGLSVWEYLDAAMTSPHMLNLYMLIEGLRCFDDHVTPGMVREIEKIRRKRKWSRIHPCFLEKWTKSCAVDADIIRLNGGDLLSYHESVRRVGKILGNNNEISKMRSGCDTRDIFDIPLTFAFYYKHPRTAYCNRPGKCGFVLKSIPTKNSAHSSKFNVHLCLDQTAYPEGLHIHPELVEIDKIHLTPMFDTTSFGSERLDMRYFLAAFTWNEMGIRGLEGTRTNRIWKVGCAELSPDALLKLVAFITF